jgi:hypothetical protein
MIATPYFIPDSDVNLNSALVLLIISQLNKTSKGRLLLNNERLLGYYHLVKNPVVLNSTLISFGLQSALLEEYDLFSVSSIAKNLDPLYDYGKLRKILLRLASLELLTAQYRKVDGFMYGLTEKGDLFAASLCEDYFATVRRYINAMSGLGGVTTTNLMAAIQRESH